MPTSATTGHPVSGFSLHRQKALFVKNAWSRTDIPPVKIPDVWKPQVSDPAVRRRWLENPTPKEINLRETKSWRNRFLQAGSSDSVMRVILFRQSCDIFQA